jgi:hypothetical protein
MGAYLVNNVLSFMEPEGSLRFQKSPTTGLDPQPVESSSRPFTLLQTYLNHLPHKTMTFDWDLHAFFVVLMRATCFFSLILTGLMTQ